MSKNAMTTRQAAAKVGCSQSTILRAIQNGYLKAERMKIPEPINQDWYSIEPEDLEAWNKSKHRRERHK